MFDLLRLITWELLGESFYFCQIDKIYISNNFKNILAEEFRATLTLTKNKVALNPSDRMFQKFVKNVSFVIVKLNILNSLRFETIDISAFKNE